MHPEITIKEESDVRIVLNANSGRVTLKTEPNKRAKFFLAYKDGQQRAEQLPDKTCERGQTCEVEISGPGVIGIEVQFPQNLGPMTPYTTKQGYVTIEAKVSTAERWPETPKPGAKPTLKEEAEAALACAVEIETKQINERVSDLFQYARDQILKAATAQKRETYFETFPIKDFEIADDNKSQPILLGPGNGKSKFMKLLLERLNDEKITVKGTVYGPNNDMKVKVELSF